MNKVYQNIITRYRSLLLVFTVLFINYSCSKTTTTEFPPVTPKWALGHIVWEDSINTQEAAELLVQLYKDNEIPVSGIIIDSP